MKAFALLPWLLAALLWSFTPGTGPLHPACAAAAGAHHVSLVVQHSGGRTLDYCVGFEGDSVTGEQVLQLAAAQYGLEYRAVAFGTLGDAVCQIDYEPQSYPATCWTSTSDYWSMWVSRGGGPWAGSNRGVSSQTFADGDAEGWHYVPQSGAAAAPPAPAGVCKATATATAPPPSAASQPAAQPTSAGVGPAVQTAASPEAGGGPSPEPAAMAAAASAGAPPAAVQRRLPATRSAALNPGLLLAAVAFGALAGLAVLRLAAPLLRR